MRGDTRERLLTVSGVERARMLGRAATRRVHDELLDSLPLLDDVEVAPTPGERPELGTSARIVCWNAERGRAPDACAALLASTGADACLLSELDCGMARTGQLHTASEIAARLDCGYAFGVEFLELGLGDERERARHRGETNRIGYHGGALLSPHSLQRPALLRLERSGRWFGPERGERRVGGRIAVLGTLAVAGVPVVLASVHLENHCEPEERADQLARLIEGIERYAPGAAVLIGGDVNTSSLGLRELEDRDALADALRRDPGRLMDPVAREPLFSVAARAGFDWRDANRVDVSTQRLKDPSRRGRLRLDWFFTRGLRVSDPEVVAAIDPATGEALSDHEAIALTISP